MTEGEFSTLCLVLFGDKIPIRRGFKDVRIEGISFYNHKNVVSPNNKYFLVDNNRYLLQIYWDGVAAAIIHPAPGTIEHYLLDIPTTLKVREALGL